MTYKVGPKGQVVLPKAIRDRVGIAPGDEVSVTERAGTIAIRKRLPRPEERAAIVAGMRAALAGQSLTASLERERRAEREREERKAGELEAIGRRRG